MTSTPGTLAVIGVATSLAFAALPAQTAAPRPSISSPSAVGTGWSAVTIGRTANGPVRLFLVSPNGVQRNIVGLPGDYKVQDVSNDGRRVIVGDILVNTFEVVDTVTRTRTPIRGAWREVRFTNPSGVALLAREAGDTGPNTDPGKLGRLVRTDLRGRVAVVMADTTDGFYTFQNPSGTQVVSYGTHDLQVNDNASGRFLRTVRTPSGVQLCSVAHWTSQTSFISGCSVWTGKTFVTGVYRFSTTGAKAVPLLPSLNVVGLRDADLDNVWQASGRTWALVHTGDCLNRRLVRVSGSTGRAVTGRAHDITMVGSQAYLYRGANTCGAEPTELALSNMVAGGTRVLAGGIRNPGFVVTSAKVLNPKA